MNRIVTLALGLTATYGVAEVNWVAPAAATDAAPDVDVAQTDMPVDTVTPTAASSATAIALSFDPPQTLTTPSTPPAASAAAVATGAASHPTPASAPRADLFAGGSDSVVARTVGAAEGTRSPDGGKTSIYEGHVDPGNGVWNRGTFSYQFGNQENLSPEEADRRQMAKMKRIYESVMLPKAEKHGVAPLTLAEEINGIDLINQAPLAVTEDGGYIERLAEAKTKKGLSGDEAILEARIWSFWDPARGGWDAPGLRAYDDMGKEASIRHDQQRRMGMINEALTAYEQQHGAIAERLPTDHNAGAASPDSEQASQPSSPAPTAHPDRHAEQRADLIIFGDSQATMPVAIAPRG